MAAGLASSGREIEPAVCAGCLPPLDYSGGPVMAEQSLRGLVVVPIYWVPRGGGYSFPPGFESTINRFIANVAAASGRTDNVFSVATEYYGEQFGARVPVRYSMRAGSALIDTDAFPHNGCTPLSGYTACITDKQLRAELTRFTHSRRLATGLSHVYPVFFPLEVETTNVDGTNSVENFCGYHGAFESEGEQIVYANQPSGLGNCGAGQAPNGNPAVDTVIAILSHELIEVMTDPLNPPRAWDDRTKHEIADLCADTYGRPLGSTSSSDPGNSEYNQIINGGKYYLPQEFSNLAYDKFGPDRGCVLSEAAARSLTAAATGRQSASPQTFVIDATPTALAADGKATAQIAVSTSDAAGNGLAGDRVHFSVDDAAGPSACGTLSSSDVATGRDGQASVTYTASKQDATCWILAVDADGGRSAEAVIHQGAAKASSPSLVASFPRVLQAGGSPATFTIKATNPSADDVTDTLTHLIIFPGGATARRVTAAQIRLSYSANRRDEAFIPVPLVGSTGSGNVIQGYIGPLRGTTLPADRSQTLTLRVTVSGSVPVSKSTPLLVFQAFLDQTNPGSGSDLTLADTDKAAVTVPTSAASHTARNVEIAAAAVFAALAALGLILWRRPGPLGTAAGARPR
jgi:hypothetical protein